MNHFGVAAYGKKIRKKRQKGGERRKEKRKGRKNDKEKKW